MTLAKKTLKPKSNQYEEFKVPTWAEWEEINKTLNELEAAKSVKKAETPKGKLKGRQSKSEKDYEMMDIYKTNKDNYGKKYSSSVKKAEAPKGKGYGKVEVADDYKKNPYKSVSESVKYIDKKYKEQIILEGEDDKEEMEDEESDSKELKGDSGDSSFDSFSFDTEDEEKEDDEEREEDSKPSKSKLKISKDYIQKILSDKPSKVKVDTISVSESGDSDSDSDEKESDGGFDFDSLFKESEDILESILNEKNENEDEDEKEETGDEERESEDNFDFDKELSDKDENDEEKDKGEKVIQKFDVSFETKNLTKSDDSQEKNITIEIIEVDETDSIYKAVLKDDDIELESDSKKCTSSSNIESLVKEVINKFFNSSSKEVNEGKKMTYRGLKNKEKLYEEDDEIYLEDDDKEYLGSGNIIYLDDEDEEVYTESEDYGDENLYTESEELDELDELDSSEVVYVDDEEGLENDEDLDEYIEEDDLDEDFEEYDEEDETEKMKMENKFYELASKIGISKENTEKFYRIFNESVKNGIESSKKRIYKKALNTLSNKLDKYLDYVVESWVRDNRVAIVENVEYRKMKRIMNNLMNVLAESNIIVNKKELKLTPIYESKISELKKENRKLLNENIDLKKKEREIKENLAKASIFLEETAGLSELSKNKIRKVLCNVKYISESQYRNKIREIKKDVLVESKKSSGSKDFEPIKKPEVLNENIEYLGTTNVSVNNSDIRNVISLSKVLDNFVPKY